MDRRSFVKAGGALVIGCSLGSAAVVAGAQAAQCGYCINGMITSAKALLDRNPNRTRRRSGACWTRTCAAARAG